MSYITLSSDPFSRTVLIRCIEAKDEHRLAKGIGLQSNPQPGCAECGQLRKNGSLFRYGEETASGYSYWDSKAFCCKGCRTNYYNLY